jgi:hypothetical protein
MKANSLKLAAITFTLVVTACGSQPTPAPSPTAPPPTLTIPAPTAVPTLALTTPTVQAATPGPTPTEASLFAPVTEADWQAGPAEALVTIVEYGDFQ